MVKKNAAAASKKAKAEKIDQEEQAIEDAKLNDVEQAIADLRLRAKEDEDVDVNKELRAIQDRIADARGVPRRPVTAHPQHKDEEIEEDEEEEEQTAEAAEEQEEEEQFDPDAEAKELINKRLTTCMLLALSYEDEKDYPKDFYEKLAESGKFDEVVKPFSKTEIQELNQLLKARKHEANERVKNATKNQEQEENNIESNDDAIKPKKKSKTKKK